jgi:hypothetical protein
MSKMYLALVKGDDRRIVRGALRSSVTAFLVCVLTTLVNLSHAQVLPDLRVSIVDFTATTAQANQAISASATIVNDGNVASSNAFTVEFLWTQNGVNFSPFIATRSGCVADFSLAPGNNAVCNAQIPAPPTAGTWYLGAEVVDPTYASLERTPANNRRFTNSKSLAVSAGGTAVQVIEYLNKPLGSYFITGRAAEIRALDTSADFVRTGMSFSAVAASDAPSALTQICRFFISVPSSGTSTHFYGRKGIDCETILAAKPAGFNFEQYDFATSQPDASGACPASAPIPVFRAFRGGTATKSANHRYMVGTNAYLRQSVEAGWGIEGAAFCVTAATEATDVFTAVQTGVWASNVSNGAFICFNIGNDGKSVVPSGCPNNISGVNLTGNAGAFAYRGATSGATACGLTVSASGAGYKVGQGILNFGAGFVAFTGTNVARVYVYSNCAGTGYSFEIRR